jgi:hypothetical protein
MQTTGKVTGPEGLQITCSLPGAEAFRAFLDFEHSLNPSNVSHFFKSSFKFGSWPLKNQES